MAKKNLRKLRKQLRNQGYTLLRSLNNAYQPGSVVQESGPGDLQLFGMVSSAMAEGSFPAIEGPAHVVLEGFEGEYELDVDAAVEMTGVDVALSGDAKNKTKVRGSFTDPKYRWVDLVKLSTKVAQQVDGAGGETLKGFLSRQNHRLVAQVLEAQLSFHFEKEGGGGVTLEGTIPNTPVGVEVNPKFKWKTNATIESTEPVIVAVQLADWHKGRGIFVADR